MYSTCLFCHSPLGANEVIEHFPVRRRLAFDAAKGRLWVVCRKCERWNLTPIEERWEAIEECERLFRDTKLRVSTDNIGLGRVREGLELVRVGSPQRPEMAAWRYGDQFGRRQRRYYTWAGAIVGGVAGVYVIGPALGLYTFGSIGLVGNIAAQGVGAVRRRAMRVKLAMPGASQHVIVSGTNVKKATLLRADNELGWSLTVPIRPTDWWEPAAPWKAGLNKMLHAYRAQAIETEFEGGDAIRVVGQLLPKVNAAGAGKNDVQEAVIFWRRGIDRATCLPTPAGRGASRGVRRTSGVFRWGTCPRRSA
jgi:hypothetical protein